MDRIDQLKYLSTERMFEGVLVDITDASVTIDIKGRLGQFKIPRRMLISEYDVKIGQEVGFMMSYPEVLDENPNEHYVNAITEHQRRQENMMKTREEI
ncbi:CBO2463/CBO2479 domain-containing protein [Vagococcus carniphilus]|uniref:CBO2463/CBO2479 domain-containing protein n=1 Tax=Vagococcus carniphilus TaxID=218144 RepID=A0A430B7E7_9ENTE|nr:CBO2463/CBO2479 domain-containing protein [Vagococcus carniphilus]MDT2814008.1 CBO2463/CBO2479 domain-containing protein [Vagococcus carniphilus]MDT2830430.1 CBO2463/CBO2479 domain-containing protein [Vagococcus carniphilus]MDT2832466.1 CBO2463/CBO2479 domain-containing protein [Vagococcus carniphilus]MDT2840001.1 CBO2463/CBO2479 domain-containing protein [Vagococcus carniphilus]MDT2848008.1 CBO2463/CBO2479 domain-containing protein [Vagococcus carniphilus]